MPTISPTSASLLVNFISSSEASVSPEGWLWMKITEAAVAEIASLNTSRGWTMLPSRLPMDISASLIKWLRVSSSAARKYSFFLPLSLPCARA
jgi:hypothetical protein